MGTRAEGVRKIVRTLLNTVVGALGLEALLLLSLGSPQSWSSDPQVQSEKLRIEGFRRYEDFQRLSEKKRNVGIEEVGELRKKIKKQEAKDLALYRVQKKKTQKSLEDPNHFTSETSPSYRNDLKRRISEIEKKEKARRAYVQSRPKSSRSFLDVKGALNRKMDVGLELDSDRPRVDWDKRQFVQDSSRGRFSSRGASGKSFGSGDGGGSGGGSGNGGDSYDNPYYNSNPPSPPYNPDTGGPTYPYYNDEPLPPPPFLDESGAYNN